MMQPLSSSSYHSIECNMQQQKRSMPICGKKSSSSSSSISLVLLFNAMVVLIGTTITSPTHAFVHPRALLSSSSLHPSFSLYSSSSIHHHQQYHNTKNGSSSNHNTEEEFDQIRQEIATLRAEAQQRLVALNEKLQQQQANKVTSQKVVVSTTAPPASTTTTMSSSTTSATTSTKKKNKPEDLFEQAAMEFEKSNDLFEKRRESDNAYYKQQEQQNEQQTSSATTIPTMSSTTITPISTAPIVTSTSTKDIHALLDDTRWRLMLNIGREQGTWMPKTWGISGERLLLNLEIEFSSNSISSSSSALASQNNKNKNTPSYYHDDFLNGHNHVKELHVVHNEAFLAPSMKEGGRRNIKISNGAWRVAPGEGPMGTNVLRFYVELQQEVRHNGSDVYCPAGRIYCTCGYFPMDKQHRHVERKDALRKQQQELNTAYQQLLQQEEYDDNENIANKLNVLNKWTRYKQKMDLRVHANKLTQQMNQLQVQEPDKSLLRLSPDQSVGLTREGGVCCKVNKGGLTVEYHILGKFEIASMKHNREHSDYRDLLSP